MLITSKSTGGSQRGAPNATTVRAAEGDCFPGWYVVFFWSVCCIYFLHSEAFFFGYVHLDRGFGAIGSMPSAFIICVIVFVAYSCFVVFLQRERKKERHPTRPMIRGSDAVTVPPALRLGLAMP